MDDDSSECQLKARLRELEFPFHADGRKWDYVQVAEFSRKFRVGS